MLNNPANAEVSTAKGDSLLYACFSIYIHLTFGVPQTIYLYKEEHISMLANKLRK